MDESGIKTGLYNWLAGELGVRHTFTITFDADLITGNVVNGTFDSESIDPVTFATSHDSTMLALADEIQLLDEVFKATVTGAREITCIGQLPGDEITVTSFVVTGGASQATATIADVVTASAPIIIFADQASPRPQNEPYATIRINNVVQIGYDEIREIDPTTKLATISGLRRATVFVEYFGTNALENIMKAYNSLERMSLSDTFSNAGFSYLEKSDVQNLTDVFETDFQPRASFDFFIGLAENIEDDLGVIETVELTGNVTHEGKDVDAEAFVNGPDIIGN